MPIIRVQWKYGRMGGIDAHIRHQTSTQTNKEKELSTKLNSKIKINKSLWKWLKTFLKKRFSFTGILSER